MRRGVPVAALDRIARRRGRQRIVGARDSRLEVVLLHHVVDDGARLLVLAKLEVGIDHVVLGVQIVADRLLRLRGLHRGDVGVDRLLPIADAGVDVRRHVLGVRRGRRDLGVAVGGVEALRGGRRIVVEVDQVMRDARMLRQPLGDRLQDRGALGLLGIGLVVQVGRGVERDGVGDLRLVVVRIFRRDLRLRVAERAHALGVAELVVVGVHHHQRVDVVALALGLGVHRLGLLDRGEAGREVRLRDRVVRIVHQRERDAPMRHGAGRVGLQGLLEDLLRVEVPVRVLIAHGAVEAALRDLVARGLEVHVAELLIDVALRDQRL